MSWLLVVQPDTGQADALRDALRAHIAQGIVVVDSLDAALATIDFSIPDVVLVPTLTPASVEEYLLAYLATRPGAGHVQILGLPHLSTIEYPVQQPTRSWFRWRRREAPKPIITPGRDPDEFRQDILDYLAGARVAKKEVAQFDAMLSLKAKLERRREPRFPVQQVPWIQLLSFAGERAALIDVSARGALLRMGARPTHRLLKRGDSGTRGRPLLALKLESHSEVHAPGQIIRCEPLRRGEHTIYEVAFSFDEAVGLHLPWSGELVPSLSAPRALPKQLLATNTIERPEYLLLPA